MSIGSIGYLVCYSISFILLARTNGAEAVGIFLLAQSIGMPLALLVGLRLQEVLGTEAQVSDPKEHYLSVGIVAIPAAILAPLGWFYLTKNPINSIGVFIILSGILKGISQVSQGRMFRLSLFKCASLFELSRGIGTLLAFCFGLLLFKSFLIAVISMLVLWAIIAIWEVILTFKFSQPHIFTGDIVKMKLSDKVRYAISDSLTIFQISSIRILVSTILGEAALGVLGAASLVIKGAVPFGTAIAKTLLPGLGKAAAAGERQTGLMQYKAINKVTILMSIAFVLIGYFVVPPLIETLMGKDLRPPQLVATIIMLGGAPLITSRFLIQILISFRERAAVEKTATIAIIVSFILAIPLIFTTGLTGAAIALTSGYLVRYFLAAYYIRRVASSSNATN